MRFLPFLILFNSSKLRVSQAFPEESFPVCLWHTTLPIHSLYFLSSYYVTGTKFHIYETNKPYFILHNLSMYTLKQLMHPQQYFL